MYTKPSLARRFSFLRKLTHLPVEEVVKSSKSLQETFPSDLEASLSDELLQCSSFFNTEFAKKALDTTASSHSSTPAISLDETNEDCDMEDDTKSNVELPELHIYRLLVSNNLEIVFPNTVISFHIYQSMMVSNSSGEWSFSKFKFLKSHLRSCMTQEQLNSLALLNIKANVLRSIDMLSLINDFALKKSRKHNIYRKSTFYRVKISISIIVYSLLTMLSILPLTCMYYNGAIYFV